MLGTKSCICACFPVLRLISLTHVIEGYRIDTRLVSPELRLELPYSNLLLERVETLVGTFTPETWTLVPELWYSVYITIPRYTPYLAHTHTHLPSHTPTHTPIYLHTPLHTTFSWYTPYLGVRGGVREYRGVRVRFSICWNVNKKLSHLRES